MGEPQMITRSVFLAVVVALSFQGTAHAFDNPRPWADKDQLLTDSGYGSSARAYGTFTVTNRDGTIVRSNGKSKIRNVDDHKVYTKMQRWSNAGRCRSGTSFGMSFAGFGLDAGNSYSCTQHFYRYGDPVSSDKHDRKRWQESDIEGSVDPSARFMRAQMWTCIAIPWRPHTCSDNPAITNRDSLP